MKRAPSPGQQIVRLGLLEKILVGHDAEIGQKVALALAEYDKLSVRPLMDRLAWLEKPWLERVWLRAGAWLEKKRK
jgi:hypothetical protein